MAAKAPTPTPPALPPQRRLTPPWTDEERLADIERMGRQVTAHVQFLLGVNGLKGMSAEAKGKSIAAFHERLTVLERQLSRIQEELMLG